MAYSDQVTLQQDAAFVERAVFAITAAAIAISNEAANVMGHDRRILLAARVLTHDPIARSLVPGVLVDSSITAGSSDAQLDARVAAIWNAYAGVVA